MRITVRQSNLRRNFRWFYAFSIFAAMAVALVLNTPVVFGVALALLVVMITVVFCGGR